MYNNNKLCKIIINSSVYYHMILECKMLHIKKIALYDMHIYRQSIAINLSLTDKNYVNNTVSIQIVFMNDRMKFASISSIQILRFVDPKLLNFRNRAFKHVDLHIDLKRFEKILETI